MKDLKDEIKSILDASAALVTLLGGKKIFWEPCPDEAILPRITYSEDNNIPAQYADNEEMFSTIVFQFGVFVDASASTSAIVALVNTILTAQGWEREMCKDGFDQERKQRVKLLKYSIVREAN